MRAKKNLFSIVLGLSLLGLAVPANATECTFDVDGFRNGEAIDQAYCDRVESTVDGSFGYGDAGGFTSRVLVDYVGGDPSLWDVGYGDLINVLIKDSDKAASMDVVLTATPGSVVRLRGFDLAALDRSFQSDPTINSLQVLDAEGNVLFERTQARPEDLPHLTISTSAHNHYGSDCPQDDADPSCAFFSVLEAPQLTIRFDSGNLGKNSDGIGIDNIRLSQDRPRGLFSGRTVIDAQAAGARSIAAADLDGDGDLDVLSAAESALKLAWYENLDGQGSFGPERPVCVCVDISPADGVCDEPALCEIPEELDFTSVRACDIDRDGDLDIVAGSDGISQEVVWYRNDGSGNFQPPATCDPDIPGDPSEAGCPVALEGSVDVLCADIDRDGDTDVVSAGSGSRVIWVPNDGTGAFAQSINIDTANSLEAIEAGDFDRDGYIDLIEGGYSQLVLSTNEMDSSSGGFKTTPNFASGSENIRALGVGDVNGDGRLDMVVAGHDCTSCPGGFVDAFFGDGAGDFERQPSLAGGERFEAISLGDVDGDGDLDALFGSGDEISWSENTGDGLFATQRVISGQSAGTEAILEADVDGDGDPDLLVASFDDGQVSVHQNKMLHRSAIFPAESAVVDAPQQGVLPQAVALADVDGDGDADLIAATGSGLTAELHLNDGAGGFADPVAITNDALDGRAVALGDVNRDARIDLLVGNADGSIVLYLNDGAGDPWDTLTNGAALAATPGSTTSLALADLNGDGALDLVAGKGGVCTTTGACRNVAYLGTGAGGATNPFAGVQPTDIGSEDENTSAVAVGDVDGDGDADVVAGNSGGFDRLYLNDGLGTFAAAGLPVGGAFATTADTTSVALADMNRDGALDLFTGSRGGENLLFFNDGDPVVCSSSPGCDPWDSAAGESVGPAAGDTTAVALADLERDGDIDLVVINDGGANLLHINDGAGSFDSASGLGSSIEGSSLDVALGDADADGDVDAVTVGCLDADGDRYCDAPGQRLVYLENLGGHYGFATGDLAPEFAFEGETTPMLCLALNLNGRPGDSTGRLISVDLQLTDLAVADPNALIDRLEIYRDIQGSCGLDALDPLVFGASELALDAAGTFTATFADHPDTRVAAPATFVVALKFKAGAVQEGMPEPIRIRHLGSRGMVQEANAGVELIAEPADDVASALTRVLDPIVVDVSGDESNGDDNISLREAVEAANAGGDNQGRPDRVVLAAETYTLSLGDLEVDEIDVTSFTEIRGAGVGETIIDASCAPGAADCLDRVFNVISGYDDQGNPVQGNLILRDLTIVGGDGAGAAVLVDGADAQATLINVEITGSVASDPTAGAPLVATNGGHLAISSSSISGNEGAVAGCLINEAGSTTEISKTTLANNVGASAGCVLNRGTMTIASSTLSGNATLGSGGAIHNVGSLDLTSGTVVLNAALMDGGGVFNNGSLSTANSILAYNAGFNSGLDCFGPVDSAGYNLIGNTAGCGFAATTGDQTGVDPRIGPLQDNGGPTLTHSLFSSSPAIDQGSCSGEATDQRGADRPLDFPGFPVGGGGISSDGCDIGSAEMDLDLLLARLRIPVRWCVLSGTDLASEQQVANDSLDDLLQQISDEIFKPQAGTVLFPAADENVRDWIVIDDPNISVCPEGEVVVDPDQPQKGFDEFKAAIAECRSQWEARSPDVVGLTAVAIRGFVDGNCDRQPLQGIGGRAPCFDIAAQMAAGRVMVVEDLPLESLVTTLGHEFGHALCLQHDNGLDDDGDGDFNDADNGAAGLSLLDGPNLMQYRGGRDLTLFQSLLLREHAMFTIPDLQAEDPTQVAGSSDGFGIEPRNSQLFEFGMSQLFEFRDSQLFEFRDSLLFEFRDSLLFEFRESQLFEFRNSLLFEFRDSQLFEFRDSQLFEFQWLDVTEFGAAFDSTTTTFYSATADAALPPALLPDTTYYWFGDLDNDALTGAPPSLYADEQGRPFPLGTDMNPQDGVSDEQGVDIIVRATLSSSCDEDLLCRDFLQLEIFDWDDNSFVKVLDCIDTDADGACDQIVSCLDADSDGFCDGGLDSAAVDFQALGLGLVQDGGDTGFTVEERKVQGLKIGFSLPTPALVNLLGQALPQTPVFRIEALTEVACSTDPNNPSFLPDGREYVCVCTDANEDGEITCEDCPDDPGCLANGIPAPAGQCAGTGGSQVFCGSDADCAGVGSGTCEFRSTFEADFGVDTIIFQPPKLPQCETDIDPTNVPGPGDTVTVLGSQLPPDEAVRVTTRDGETLFLADGELAAGCLACRTDANGEVTIEGVLIPDGAIAGEFEAQIRTVDPVTFEDQDAIRASCVLLIEGDCVDSDEDGLCDRDDVCPNVPDPQNDGDEDGYCAPDDNCPLTPNADQADNDGDGAGDPCDTDDDNDGCTDGIDPAPLTFSADLDGDGEGNDCDGDDDNDGVADGADAAALDSSVCRDVDGDGCDDCTNTGADLSGGDIANDGADNDGDGTCDFGDADDDNDGCADSVDPASFVFSADPDGDGEGNDCDVDDDNDGVIDTADPNAVDPNLCGDIDGDTCDDCAVGTDDFGPLADNNPANDGTDNDGDGACDAGDADDDNDGCADTGDPAPFVFSADPDGDGEGNDCDVDDDNDGVEDGLDANALNPNVCRDADGDTCDDCTNTGADLSGGDTDSDGPDNDGDGACDAGDNDDDNDGCTDEADPAPLDSSADPDADGEGNDCDTDDDNDGVTDGEDSEPLNPAVCRDVDGDTCDDCSNTGANLSGGDTADDGADNDEDGTCDAGDSDDDNDGCEDGDDPAPFTFSADPDDDGEGNDCDVDDDNDGVEDSSDADALNPNICRDADGDSCDDCTITGADLSGGNPGNDGPDNDEDGACDAGDSDDDNDGCVDGVDPAPFVFSADPDGDGGGNDCDVDDDNDGVADGADTSPFNPNVCSDSDADGCDDCAVGTDDFGPLPDNQPAIDGSDTDADGFCDLGDADDDNDGVVDASDPSPFNPDLCGDSDNDTCDDCSVRTDGFGPLADYDPANDGPDADGDGVCDPGEIELTVFKQVINDNDGTLEERDFTIAVTGAFVENPATGDSGTTLSLRSDTLGTELDLAAGDVTVEENPIYSDFYSAAFCPDDDFDGNCDVPPSPTGCNRPIGPGDRHGCIVVNDDNEREQTSMQFTALTVAVGDSPAGNNDLISGEFALKDSSSGGATLTILLDDYETDFEYKKKNTWEAADFVADWFLVQGAQIFYVCDYTIVETDGVAGSPADWVSGDPVEFDEVITVGYECLLLRDDDSDGTPESPVSMPNNGTIRATASSEIFGRPGFTYTHRISVSAR